MHNKKKSTVNLTRATSTATTTTTSIESIITKNLRSPTLFNNRVLHFPRTSLSTYTNSINLYSAGQGNSNTRSTANIEASENAHFISQSHHEESLKLIEKRDAIRLRLAILDIEAVQKRQRLLEDHEKQQRQQEEIKKQRQYHQQVHHQEPIHLKQANTAQQPQTHILFGQQQPQGWY
ncbi:hypothetical protein BGZ90_010962 [Linnemannia elongata]|nr:hypothetical protein BGZ90_010962 [Linnemannia elongata]